MKKHWKLIARGGLIALIAAFLLYSTAGARTVVNSWGAIGASNPDSQGIRTLQVQVTNGTGTAVPLDAYMALTVNPQQQVSFDSTSTPLTGSATYTTATPVSLVGWARITGTVFADQAGTLNIDQSSDGGGHWDYTTTIAITASTGAAFSVEVVSPLARLRYVNGSSAQTAFRLYSWMRRI
ncbi:MAG: hypothetical protein KGJ86_21435 [Chloroflexota bacterium]|nr:hypothetical protein [Chloroflexota bacterium]